MSDFVKVPHHVDRADVMALEQRGYRPGPHERGPVAAFIHRDLDRKVRQRMHIEMSFDFHMMWWGVPCGPTLSMVNPPRLRAITTIVRSGS